MGNYKEIGAVGHFLSSILFILAIQSLSNIKTAQKGIWIGCFGMGLSIIMTIYKQDMDFVDMFRFLFAFIPGGIAGIQIARKTQMIKLPQNLALFQTFVGFAIILVSFTTIIAFEKDDSESQLNTIEIFIGMFLGAFKTSASLVGYLKLEQRISRNAVVWFETDSFRQLFNLAIIIVDILLLIIFFFTEHISMIILLAILNILLGVHISLAIKTQDMPILIAFLSGISGYATSASGFMIDNSMLIICGALIGSSGMMLSQLVSKSLNKKFWGVILSLDTNQHAPIRKGTDDYNIDNSENELNQEEVVNLILGSKNIIIVPGYNLAAQQVLEQIYQITQFFDKHQIFYRFCVHPMAGRIPGQMGVLLSEAGIQKKYIVDNDQCKEQFKKTDLVLVLEGAHLCNPTLVQEKKPVCEVWNAKKIVVFKRGRKSELDNSLFAMDNVQFCFGSITDRINDILEGFNKHESILQNQVDESLETVQDIQRYAQQAFLKLGLLKENQDLEKRVALTPVVVRKLVKLGFQVQIERSAGLKAGFSDEEYENNGGIIVESENIYENCEIFVKIRTPTYHNEMEDSEIKLIMRNKNAKLLITECMGSNQKQFLNQLVNLSNSSNDKHVLNNQKQQQFGINDDEDEHQQQEEQEQNLHQQGDHFSIFGIDKIVRGKRTRDFDVIREMGNLKGQKVIYEVINQVQNVNNLEVLIIGTSQTCISAIQQLKQIQCTKNIKIVLAGEIQQELYYKQIFGQYDVTIIYQSESQQQIQNEQIQQNQKQYYPQQSLKKTINKHIVNADVVISDVQIFGESPIIIAEEIIAQMKFGSIIVDLGIEYGGSGGNCECTKIGEIQQIHGVKIIGLTDFLSRIPQHASELYANNLFSLFSYLLELHENPTNNAKNFKIDYEDEIISNMTILKQGKFVWKEGLKNRDQIELDQLLEEQFTKSVRKMEQQNNNPDMSRDSYNIQLDIIQKQGNENDREVILKDDNDNQLDSLHKEIYLITNFQFIEDLSQKYSFIEKIRKNDKIMSGIFLFTLVIIAFIVGSLEDAIFIEHLFVFLLSMFVGRTLIKKIDPILYTVLMSATTALSGVIIVGSMYSETNALTYRSLQGFLGILFTSFDIFGGFMITNKILQMFQK